VGTATLPVGVMVPKLSMPVTGVQAARVLGRRYGPRISPPGGGAAHAETVYAFIGNAHGPGTEFVTTRMRSNPHHCPRQITRVSGPGRVMTHHPIRRHGAHVRVESGTVADSMIISSRAAAAHSPVRGEI
jgi:hypothetical protein